MIFGQLVKQLQYLADNEIGEVPWLQEIRVSYFCCCGQQTILGHSASDFCGELTFLTAKKGMLRSVTQEHELGLIRHIYTSPSYLSRVKGN